MNNNHQTVYYHESNALGLSFNLLTFGFRQFSTTTQVEKIAIMKKLSEEFNSQVAPNEEDIKELIFDKLIDSIKITICFENYMKAFLISNGYVVHKLDKQIFSNLFDIQKKRPVLLSEVRAIRDWEIVEQRGHQIPGISKHTLGISQLLSKEYLEVMNLDENLISLCKPYFEYRNNLHFYVFENSQIGKNTYSDFVKVIEFVNNKLVVAQNRIADLIHNGQNKIKKIII